MTDMPLWTYRRDHASQTIECGYWSGSAPPARASHFHDVAQLTLVIAGRRSFELGGRRWDVFAGQSLVIPAGVVHRSLDRAGPGTRCLNVYIDLPEACRAVVIDTGRGFDQMEPSELVAMVCAHFDASYSCSAVSSVLSKHRAWRLPDISVGAAARAQGLTREAYTRGFTRAFGMPPHGYRLVQRLNAARRTLAAGGVIAEVAAQFGFADQSHFGRHFRRVFGVTPRAYREGMRTVTNVPDLDGKAR